MRIRKLLSCFLLAGTLFTGAIKQQLLAQSAALPRGPVLPMAVPCTRCANLGPPKRSIVLAGPIILYITSQNATCGYGSGSIIVQAANGTAPYQFTLDSYAPQNTGNFPVVGAGVHTIVVTDATGASTTVSLTLTDILPGPVLVPYTILSYPGNCSMSNGSIQLQPTGGTQPYTYSMDLINFQTSPVFSGLPSGSYYFYVRDAAGCIGSILVFMDSFGCDANEGIIGGYECENDGGLNAKDVSFDGNGPFQYSLDGGSYQPTGNYTGLGPGLHILLIKDNFGIVKTYGVTYAQNCQLAIQYVAVSAACQQDNGSLTVTAGNGTPPYTYTIDGINYQPGNVFNNLAPGNYYVTAKDLTGVTSSVPATVYDRCPVVEAVASPATCAGNDGVITAAGFKGTAPYQYSIDGVNFQAANSFGGRAPGNYTITIRDALGFTGTVQVTVTNACLNVTASMTSSTCGSANGTITAGATDGTTPYQFSIDGVNFQPGGNFGGLASGPYTVTVKDAVGLSTTTTITVTNIPGPQLGATAASASCLNNDGGIDAAASAGTTPYQYALNGGGWQPGGVFAGLDTGAQVVRVQDANGCAATTTVTVPLVSNLTVDAGNAITLCQGKSSTLNGSTNGSGYTWTPATGLTGISNLQPAVAPDSSIYYYLTATLGICTATDSVMVLVHPAPVANAGADTGVCPGKSIQLQGSGGIAYQWSPDTWLDNTAIADPTVTAPTHSITYSLVVTDVNQCQSLEPSTVTVTLTPPPSVFAGNDTSVLVGQPLPLQAIDIGNSGFDSWQWSPVLGLSNPSIADPVATITGNITYYVTATTADGCVGTDSIAIKAFTTVDILAPNAFTPNGDGHNDVFRAIPLGIKDFHYLAVFNRWGQRVFYSTDPGKGWDGTIGGQSQPAGVYVWMAAGVDYQGEMLQRKGTVILIK
jgi:gliding motility-associated-like protein